jgi:TamB, inner membrane protein subunit of TAM complex
MARRVALLLLLAAAPARADVLGDQVAAALSRAGEELLGAPVRIGGVALEGSRVLLRDVTVLGPDGAPEISIAALAIDAHPAALLQRTLFIERIQATGVTVAPRRLAGGDLNLGRLGRRDPGQTLAPSLSVVVGRAIVDGRLRGQERLDAAFHAEGRLVAASGGVDLTLERLTLGLRAPLEAAVTGRGGLFVGDAGLRLHDVVLEGDVEATELERLTGLPLVGRWRTSAHLDGPLERLAIRAQLRPPHGEIQIDGTWDAAGAGEWRSAVRAQGIDPAEAWRGGPPGQLSLVARGRGVGDRASWSVERLLLEARGIHLEASGRYEPGHSLDARIELDAEDVSALSAFVARDLAGRLKLRAHVVREGAHSRVDAEGSGARLSLGRAHADAIDFSWHSADLVGRVRIALRDVRVAAVRLDRLALEGDGDRRGLSLRLQGSGPEGALIRVEANGAPTGRGLAARGRIQRLEIGRRGDTWRIDHPAGLRIDRGVAVRDLDLRSADSALRIDGRWSWATGDLDATARFDRLDAERIARLVDWHGSLPSTRFTGSGRVRGAAAHPTVSLDLAGDSAASPALALPALHHRLDLTLGAGRLRGHLEARGGDLEARAAIDLPIERGVHPLSLALDVRALPLAAIPRILALPTLPLEGTVDLHAHAGGTTRDPEVELALVGRALRIDEVPADLDLQARYRTAVAAGSLSGHLDGGSLATSWSLPIQLDIAAGFSWRILEERPASASARIVALRLSALPRPLRLRGWPGRLSGRVELAGTLAAIDGEQDLTLAGVDLPGLGPLELRLEARQRGGRLALTATARLPAGEVGALRGAGALDLPALLRSDDRMPLKLDGTLSANLDRLGPGFSGALSGSWSVGAGGARAARLRAEGRALHVLVGEAARLRLSGAWDVAGASVRLDAESADGGTLRASARWSRDSLKANIDPVGLRLRTLRPIGPIRLAAVRLDGHVAIGRAASTTSAGGQLTVADGRLELDAGDDLPYERAALLLRFEGPRIVLERAEIEHAGGHLQARGTAELEGIRPRRFDLRLTARALPLSLGGPGPWHAWVDADAGLHGELAGPPSLVLTIDRALARLPSPELDRTLIPLGPLVGVHVRADASAPAPRSPPSSEPLSLTIHAPNTIRLVSLDPAAALTVDVGLAADLTLQLGERRRGDGALWSTGGAITLFGRAYRLERGRLSFRGSPDGEIDLRATRPFAESRVVLSVRGTIADPALSWSAEPPIYDDTQVARLLLAGQPGVPDEASVATLSGAVWPLLQRALLPRQLQVIDVLRARSDQTGLGLTSFELGKTLGDHLYLGVAHRFQTVVGLRRLNANEAQVEWRIRPRLVLEALYGDAGVGSLDLSWSIRR